MRGVNADRFPRFSLQADEGAGLCTVTVQHIQFEGSRKAKEMKRRHRIDRMWFPAYGEPIDSELEFPADLLECRIRARSAREAVGENADLMSVLGLAYGEIKDVTENPADRRANGMQNAERGV